MFMQQQEQQPQQQYGNYWVDYQGRNNVQTDYSSAPNMMNNDHQRTDSQENASRTYVYRDNYSGPENGCEYVYHQTQPHIYENANYNVNNNQPNLIMTQNFVNQNEIVNSNSSLRGCLEENIHKRKFDSIDEKDEILEDDEDQSPTVANNEFARDAKRVKKSLSSILANLQVSEEDKPQPNSKCTQLMCYNENISTQTPKILNQPTIDETVNDLLRKKLLSSIMAQPNGKYIPDPKTDLKLQSTNEEEEDDNQTAVVLYRDVIGRDEVLRKLAGQQNENPQSTNQMSDE
ncbi:predicted protein [Naegleria gruberi]|uniref:Predicted protein n=1 Tax=Naegleria gruberi TaxID=5762 RepID=D2VK45_NAEGR|nr:uncharacterized protein NAEGRDRAFT_50207 [Naegleria gruberi]EFC42798.1 predicted protein [Naegleria gruberi]|eukprot:XP_002675542.1 predicted protein [Naegleria gruberi strain NEG-M]